MIVTFTCTGNKIFEYRPKCGKKPMPPFKAHQTTDQAKEYLKSIGFVDFEIIEI